MKDSSTADGSRKVVVLVHGLLASPWMMRVLSSRLAELGYETLNFGYRSIRFRIENHSERLADVLRRFENDSNVESVHIVAHSMGAIITRLVLSDEQLSKVRRVIMLGPPNAGSPTATRLSRLLGSFCPPLNQLSDRPGSLVNQLPHSLPYEVGTIAASRDRVVPIDNTHLSCQADHLVVASGHNGLLFRRTVFEQVRHFLGEGCFSRKPLRLFDIEHDQKTQVA